MVSNRLFSLRVLHDDPATFGFNFKSDVLGIFSVNAIPIDRDVFIAVDF